MSDLYKKYLEEILPLIFNNESDVIIDNEMKDQIQYSKRLLEQNMNYLNNMFDGIEFQYKEYVIVRKNNLRNFYNLITKQLVSEEWFDSIDNNKEDFKRKLIKIKKGDVYNLLNLETGKTLING